MLGHLPPSVEFSSREYVGNTIYIFLFYFHIKIYYLFYFYFYLKLIFIFKLTPVDNESQ